MEKWFRILVKEEVFKNRDITKKQYKALSRWSRTICRELHADKDFQEFIQNSMNIVVFKMIN